MKRTRQDLPLTLIDRCIHGTRLTAPCEPCRALLAHLGPYTAAAARERAVRRRHARKAS